MADEPPSISDPVRDYVDAIDAAVAAEVAWRDVLVAESQGLQPDGCCSADVWRGHLCPYHQGYADGVDAVLERMRAVGWMIGDPLP